MKNLLIRAVTLICGVTFQFALSMLIQLWTNYNPGDFNNGHNGERMTRAGLRSQPQERLTRIRRRYCLSHERYAFRCA